MRIYSGERSKATILTILETAATASRAYDRGVRLVEPNRMLDRRRVIGALLKRLFTLDLHFINLPGETSMKLLKHDVVMPAIFRESLSLTLKIGIRSFDLLHLSAAKYARETLKAPIQVFVTGDRDFLEQKAKIGRIVEFSFLSPEEYTSAMGL